MKINIPKLSGPYNQYAYFVGPNPSTSINPYSICPKVDSSAFIGPFSSIIGDVTICKNVFIACNVAIRADEGTPFFIGNNSNLQDGVILHGLEREYVIVDGKKYSICIDDNVSCAHGSIVHGPCFIGGNTFIGVKAVIFNACVSCDCYVGTGAIVTNGVRVGRGRFVPPGAIIDTQEKADSLGPVPRSDTEFAESVITVNSEFPYSYNLLFGDLRCSCGLCCCSDSVKNHNIEK